MSDYTPTIERFRREYVEMRAEHFGFADLYGAEFDRMLERVRRETLQPFLEIAAQHDPDRPGCLPRHECRCELCTALDGALPTWRRP